MGSLWPTSTATARRSGDRGLGSENTVSVLLGNGNGTFQAKHDYAAATFPESVAVGDFNGDGE